MHEMRRQIQADAAYRKMQMRRQSDPVGFEGIGYEISRHLPGACQQISRFTLPQTAPGDTGIRYQFAV